MNHLYPPLSLLNSVVYVEKEFSVKIIDQRIDSNWKKHLLEELMDGPLCVGITSLTGEQVGAALKVTEFIKAESSVPIVWGGAHPSILPQQTLSHPCIDYVIEGEGEIALYELVMNLANNGSFEKIRGLWYKEDDIIRNNPPAEPIDLNALPDPPYHLLDIEKYILRFDNRRMFVLESSRGCPNKCAFCCVQKSKSLQKWRGLTAENTIAKIKHFKDNYDIEGVELLDIECFVDIDRIKKFSKLLIEEDMQIFWNANARITDILKLDQEAIKHLEKSGLRRLAVGVESGSDRMLKMINKGITINQVMEASRKLLKTSIHPYYSFIAGFPTETESELKMTTELIMKLLKDNPRAKVSVFHCFRPLPGTRLYDLCIEKGLRVPAKLRDWACYDMGKIDYPWLSPRMQMKISALHFLSLFIDRKYEEIDSLPVKVFAKLYKGLARYRFEHYDFRFFVEPYFKQIFLKIRR
ncbi:B12-binding domain-containing radical SAM protein [Candidatus Altiarchaeota archaeon]